MLTVVFLRLSSDSQQIFDCFHINQHRLFHAGHQNILIRAVDPIIDAWHLRTESDDIFQRFCVSPAADHHRFVLGISGYIYIRFIQCFHQWRICREEQGFPYAPDLYTTISSSSFPSHMLRSSSSFRVTGTRISMVQEITPSSVFTIPLQKVRSP